MLTSTWFPSSYSILTPTLFPCPLFLLPIVSHISSCTHHCFHIYIYIYIFTREFSPPHSLTHSLPSPYWLLLLTPRSSTNLSKHLLIKRLGRATLQIAHTTLSRTLSILRMSRCWTSFVISRYDMYVCIFIYTHVYFN